MNLAISVSKLTAFDDFVHGRWEQNDDTKLRQTLLGTSEKTYEKSIGDAIHGLIQQPKLYQPQHDLTEEQREQAEPGGLWVQGMYLAPGIVETCLNYRATLPDTVLFEQWLPPGCFSVRGFLVYIRARIDVLTPAAIRDIKTSKMALDTDHFTDSYQWRLYLLLSGFDRFEYDHFQFHGKKQSELRYKNMSLFAYDHLRMDCEFLIAELIDYCRTRDLMHTITQKVK